MAHTNYRSLYIAGIVSRITRVRRVRVRVLRTTTTRYTVRQAVRQGVAIA